MDPSSDQQPPQVTEAVPINIAPSTEDAPPTLAEPASGPVATMSGALQGADGAEAPKTTVETTGKSTMLLNPLYHGGDVLMTSRRRRERCHRGCDQA